MKQLLNSQVCLVSLVKVLHFSYSLTSNGFTFWEFHCLLCFPVLGKKLISLLKTKRWYGTANIQLLLKVWRKIQFKVIHLPPSFNLTYSISTLYFILSQWHSFILRLCAKLSGCWVGKLFLVHSNARWHLHYQQPVSEWMFVSPHTKPYFKQVCLCVSQVIFTLAWLIACRLSLQYLWQAEKYPLKVSQINPV